MGDSALICAAGSGYVRVVKLLIDSGVRLHEANDKGSSAQIKAARSGHDAVAAMLMDAQKKRQQEADERMRAKNAALLAKAEAEKNGTPAG